MTKREERLLELYMENYISKTQYGEMLKRIRESNKKKEKDLSK